MKTTAEMIEVMQAFERGEKIEFKQLTLGGHWFIASSPNWDWALNDYRIKPLTEPVKLYWAVLKSFSTGELICTNPKSLLEYKKVIEGYCNTTFVIREYSDTFEMPVK